MTVQSISQKSIAIFFDKSDLNSRGIEPQTISTNTTISLARQAFNDVGMPIDGTLDVDAYINDHGIMMFAVIRDPFSDIYALYDFDCLENAIGAAHALNEAYAPPSTFIYYKNHYYLAFHACQKKPNLESFSEFGSMAANPELKYLFLIEYGEIICRANAVATITSSFHRNPR